MINPAIIPNEVVRAVEKVLTRYLVGGYTFGDKESIGNVIVAAALNVWPVAYYSDVEFADGRAFDTLVLPLPEGDA